MNKIIISFFILLTAFSVQGQFSFKEHYFERNKSTNESDNYLEVDAGYMLNSKDLSNTYVKTFYQGGFIDNELKEKELNNFNSYNSLGLEAKGQIVYKRAMKDFNLRLSVSSNLVSNATFDKDFFNVLMYGNAPTAGRQMNLSNTAVKAIGFNKYGLGIEKQVSKSIFIGGSVHMNQGLFYYDTKLTNAYLYTEPDGSEVRFDGKFSQSYSDENSKGLGAGVDLYLASKYEKGFVFVQVEDLGFMRYKNLVSYELDSSISFRGVEIIDILDLNEGDFDALNGDDLHQFFGVAKSTIDKAIFTPAKVTIGMQKVLGERLFLEVYANYRFIHSYIPQMIIRPNIFFGKNFSIAPVLSLGGYGKSDLGLNVSYHKSKFFVVMDILELENLILSDASSGRGTYLKTGFLF